MKKVLTLLLALVMVLSLTACVASQPTTGSKNDPTKPTTAPTNKPTEPTTAPTQPEEIVFPETVIAETDDCTFKIVSIDTDMFGYTLKVYMENKSSVTQMFSMSDVTVNNYMCDPFWACEVSAGLKQNSEVTFSYTDLERNGITTPTKIEFKLTIYDSEGWDAKEFFAETCTIYPQGEDKYVDDGGYTAQEGDTVLVDNENCTVIVTGYENNEIWGFEMHLYILNKSDKSLTFAANGLTVNDLMLDPWWYTSVAAGMRSHCYITWMGDLETYEVGEVTKINFQLSATDPTSLDGLDYAAADCTVYPMGEAAYQSYQRAPQDTDVVLLDNEYVTVTVIGIDPEGIMGYTVNLFIQSKSDMNLRVDADDVSVNGFEMDPWWATTVNAGKCVYSSISWFTGDLEFNGITAVEAITMTLKVYDEEAWEPFTSDAVTINP